MRNFIRIVGLMMLLSIYISSGIQKILDPEAGAAMLAQSNFPVFLRAVGIHPSQTQYRRLIQATGCLFVGFSLFVLLGVGRPFFSFLLAMGTVVITLSFYVDIRNPMATSTTNVQMVLSNVAIIGALLFVTGCGRRSQKYFEAKEQAAARHGMRTDTE